MNIFGPLMKILDSGRSHDGFFIGVDGFADAARPSPDVRGEVAKDEGTWRELHNGFNMHFSSLWSHE